jgi:hypothetical protein
MVERENVPFIAVETPYSDDETSDGWHANDAGRLRVTNAPRDELSRQAGS